MFVIIGIIVVIASVVVGFTMAGGNLMLIIQIAEFVIICGVAFGSMLIMAPLTLLKKIFSASLKSFAGFHVSKKEYLELLKSFNDLFLLAQRDGLIALERHVENPNESDFLARNKKFIKNEVARDLFCDTLKVLLSGGIKPHEVEMVIDTEIETFEAEQKPVHSTLAKIADAMPGLGIVAAVLGVIVTMTMINEGAEAVGKHVAAALVGTFLGILLSYGFLNPLATNIELNLEHEVQFLETIKACVTTYSKGAAPIIAVEVARRTIPSDSRPTFQELESYIRGK